MTIFWRWPTLLDPRRSIIMAVITWMAGLFYLPKDYRLSLPNRAEPGDSRDQVFTVMEGISFIASSMKPSVIVVWVFGLILVNHHRNCGLDVRLGMAQRRYP